MAKLKLMCAFIAELLRELRDDPETQTIPFVLDFITEDTIHVFVEEPKEGLIHYIIKMSKKITVKEVYDNFLENDLVDLASVEGYKFVDHEDVCCGSLFHGFAGGDDPIRDRISTQYSMDFFRYSIKRAVGTVLGIINQ